MKAIEAQNAAYLELRDLSGSDAKRDSQLILAHILNCKIGEIPVTEKHLGVREQEQLKKILDMRKNRIPLQYILGETEFMSLKFKVNPSVLIPRGDTERIVEAAISILKNKEKPMIADICCGSGNIAISLAYYLPNAKVWATDISKDAISLALENADIYKLNNRIQFLEGDLLRPIASLNLAPQLIISNPPYIKSTEIAMLQAEVQKEPRLALNGGEDGLEFYRRLSIESYDILPEKGYLLFETGFDQKETVIKILRNNKYQIIETINDFGGNHRGILAQKNL